MAVGTGILPERYRDPRLVARGGMGEVYRAVDTLLGRPVAIKLLAERYAEDEEIRRRFTREAQAAARLSGEPSTVTIYDVGEADGRPFIVMEYVPAGSLEDVLRREGAQPPERALGWLEDVARALDHAHRNGVVHRDVKPANLLLDDDGAVHVADFGVASAAGLDSLTRTGTILGTAGYLAPEQAEGRPSGPASDRYALGVVAFELLTGTRPFQTESITAEAAAHVHAPVPAISQRRPGLPPAADEVFRRALAKDPESRFTSCVELVAALREALDGAATTRIAAPLTRSRRRRPLLPLLLALAGLLGAGVGLAVAVRGDHADGSAAPPVTVTQRGPTVRETVTAQAPRPSTTTSGASGAAIAQQGYRRLKSGDPRGALPLLQHAARMLQGTGSLDEAYNDYNLAFALATTQGCSPPVLELLSRSEAIQGHRSEIDHLRKACRGHGKHRKRGERG